MYVPQSVPAHLDASRSISTWLRQALLASLAGMFFVPFIWPRHTMPIPSFYGEAVAAFVLLSTAFLALCISSTAQMRSTSRNVPYVALIFVPLVVVLCLQLWMGKLTFAENALFPIMLIGLAIGATMLGASCSQWYGHERMLAWICIALIAGGCWNVAAQIVQLTKFWSLTALFSYSKGALYGNLAQANHLATYLGWSLIATLYLFAKARLRLSVTIIFLTIFLAGLVLTASRMSWLQTAWTAGAGAYLVSRMDPPSRPRYWPGIVALPLALLVATIVLPHAIEFIQLNFPRDAGQLSLPRTAIERLRAAGLDGNRWLIYAQAWEIFKAHPLLGIGPGELQFNQLLLMDHYRVVLFASSAHNLVLDLLVMTGSIGAAGFAWFGVGWLLRMRKQAATLETTAMLLMLAVLGIHTLLEFPECYGFFLFPTAFLLGALESRFLVFRANLASRTLPLIAVLYGIGCSAVLWYQYHEIETLYREHYQKNPEAKAASVDLLTELYLYRERSLFVGPADFVLSWNLELNPQSLVEKLKFSERAVRYQPGANVLYRHIILLSLAGREKEAIFYLPRLRASFPTEFSRIAENFIEAGEKHPALFGRIAAETRTLLQER